ncbi:MAG: hypothetical protein ACRDKU_09750 [Gaiellaceae bacterium]
MTRALRTLVLTALAALALSGNAQAAGGNYVVDGGTAKQRGQVKAALNASAFNWSVVPAQIKIHVARVGQSKAVPGEIWIDSQLLNSGRFAWGVVQHEYAHQVDFFLFDTATRSLLATLLGGKAWCWETAGLKHDEYGCERFASTLAWAYWPAKDSAMRPDSKSSESASMAPARFRTLMAQILGAAALSTKNR